MKILCFISFLGVAEFAAGHESMGGSSGAGDLCPDCSKVKCGLELVEDDCPPGTVLTPNMLFGCCPACVKYLDFGEPCPGIFSKGNYQNPFYISWGQYVSTNGANYVQVWNPDYYPDYEEYEFEYYDYKWLYYPNEFISATERLPCSSISLYEEARGKTTVLPERIFSSYWATSNSNINKTVPVIDSARCSPNLRCFLTQQEMDEEQYEHTQCLGPLENIQNNFEPESFKELPCTYRKADYSAFLRRADCSVRYWQPECQDLLGVFGPVQQKSADSPAWCSSPSGSVLFGKEKATRDEPEINCKCSRKRWDLEQTKSFEVDGHDVNVESRADVSLHCSMNGNYEMLQCDQNLCWCMNPETGLPSSKIVSENLMRFLPCYDRLNVNDKVGGKYLRKCESRSIGIERTSTFLREHGTVWIVEDISCDPSGGFDKTFCDGSSGICYCVSSDMRKGMSFANSETYTGPTCNCARDFLDGVTYSQTCDGYGNYPNKQTMSNPEGNPDHLEHCVDFVDNWRVSGEVPTLEDKTNPDPLPCCLDSDLADQSWAASSEENRNSFRCREYGGVGNDIEENKGNCDNSAYCRDILKDCSIGV